MKKKFLMGIALIAALALCGCGASGGDGDLADGSAPPNSETDSDFRAEGFTAAPDGSFVYDTVKETEFKNTAEEESVYFSLDRNTANYSQVRAQIMDGRSVAPDSVRIEELLNYFSYDYPAPAEGEAMKASAYLTDCPWEETHALVTVGVKTQERSVGSGKNNYVLLIDVSGSMGARVAGGDGVTCLGLVKYGVGGLVNGLGEQDAVSVLTYAGTADVLLEPTLATPSGKTDILAAVNGLQANGSTNGSGGLERAYELAARHFSEGGNNRVILLSDGDFNVGATSQKDLLELIEEKAKTGVYLSVIGVGIGNMRDDLMQTLALHGNGNYAYVDTYSEADKVFGEELYGMLVPVAKDAKAGMTFSKETVEKYRLIGYDMKLMSEEDFDSPEKDAGEIGSNLCVTALFEVELKENVGADALLGSVEVRFRDVGEGEAERSVTAEVRNTRSESEDAAFAACVAEFGLILRQSAYKGTASYDAVLRRLGELSDYLGRDSYRSEFKTLVSAAKLLSQA